MDNTSERSSTVSAGDFDLVEEELGRNDQTMPPPPTAIATTPSGMSSVSGSEPVSTHMSCIRFLLTIPRSLRLRQETTLGKNLLPGY